MSCFGRWSNNVNEAEIMNDIFGHSNIFATHSLTHSHYTLNIRMERRLNMGGATGDIYGFACPWGRARP
jgi:hypothetical protein